MFQNKFADFIIISDIIVRILTGHKYFSYYWLRKSNIKDRGVNLYGNEPESSINLVAFPTNICFQMYLFLDHFEV